MEGESSTTNKQGSNDTSLRLETSKLYIQIIAHSTPQEVEKRKDITNTISQLPHQL